MEDKIKECRWFGAVFKPHGFKPSLNMVVTRSGLSGWDTVLYHASGLSALSEALF